MLKNYKYFSIFLITIFLLFLSIEFCSAREFEVDLPGLTPQSKLPDYIKVLFKWGIGIAEAIAVLALVIGGIRYMTSAGNPEAISSAKKTIKGALFGLILLVSSHLILRTISPKLIELTPPELKDVGYLYLVGNGEKKPCPVGFIQKVEDLPDHIRTIKYECLLGAEDPYLVYLDDAYNWEGNVTVEELECNGDVAFGGKKVLYVVPKHPGVYLYKGTGGYRDWYGADKENLSDHYWPVQREKVKSCEIYNRPDKDIFYGAILHEEVQFKGKCEGFYDYESGGKHSNVLLPNASSISVYKWNPEWGEKGDGVIFHSDTNYGGGFYEVKDENIDPVFIEDLDQLDFNYTGTNVPPEERERYPTLAEGLKRGSIEIKGNYWVVLLTSNLTCQIFKENDLNLKPDYIFREGRSPDSVMIIPVK